MQLSIPLADRLHKFYLSASLQVVASVNGPEILREAGPQVCVLIQIFNFWMRLQGLHVKDIGDKCGSDPYEIGEWQTSS